MGAAEHRAGGGLRCSAETADERVPGDLRFALRGLARTPRVTAVVVLTLTLGIGATAAVFSVVDAVLLERLPYRQPEQLFMVDTTYHSPTGGIEPQPTSWLDFRDWRERQRSFAGLAAFSNPRSFHLRVAGEVQPGSPAS